MSEDFKDNLAEDHRSDILKQLDTFNTAPEFGMMGILQEQLQESPQSTPETPEEPKTKEATIKEPDYEKVYAPLNSSIQEMGYRMDGRIADLERQIASHRETAQPQAQQPQYDPDQPVTMAQLMALQNEVQGTGRQAQQAELRAEYLRAHLEYERFKQRNPDFVVSTQDLDNAFSRHVSNDLNKARNTNWTGHFAQIHEQTVQPRMKNRISELEKEVEELKKKGTRAAQPETRISPATSTTPTASARSTIQSPGQNSGQLDVVNLSSFKKGKSFKSYANDIKRHYGITNQAN